MANRNPRIKTQGKRVKNRTTARHDVSDSPLLEQAQRWIVRHNVEHLHGPEEEISYEKDELLVLCLLRNGKPYINSFIEHYFSLGVKHIVFLDNGSTDGTVEALRGYENVTILRTGLPFKRYQLLMKQYLIERYGVGRWTLSVDIDELFDYPYSDAVGLRALLGYLSEHRYTAVVSYMLDMFPEQPLSETVENGEAPLKELHRFYDLSNLSTRSYLADGDLGNTLSNEDVGILQGGVQRRLFDLHPLLIKHPLIFFDSKVKPVDMSEHWASNAHVADFTGVLLHYKLLGGLYELVRREIRERSYPNRHGKYDKYLKVLGEAPSLQIKDEASRELESVNDLVGTSFAIVSEEYVKFAGGKARENRDHSGPDRLIEAFFRAREEAGAREEEAQRLRPRVGPLHRKVRRKRGEATSLEDRARVLEKQIEDTTRGPRGYVENLEAQLRALQSSRSWKLLNMPARIKARIHRMISAGRLSK